MHRILIDYIDMNLKSLRERVEKRDHVLHSLISQLIALRQDYRIAKNYEMSDKIRDILDKSGVDIIQGTAPLTDYDQIKEKFGLSHPQVNDTYKIRG